VQSVVLQVADLECRADALAALERIGEVLDLELDERDRAGTQIGLFDEGPTTKDQRPTTKD
jgi:hypothetical protein